MNDRLIRISLKLTEKAPKSIQSQFKSLKNDLARAGMTTGFDVYIGLMIFTFFVTGAVAFSLLFLVTSTRMPILSAFFLSFIMGALAAGFSVGICTFYPQIAISSKKRKIETSLPQIANFMSVLASAGLPPERIFRSLANVGDEFGIGYEARRIIADVELMGLDLNAALKNASFRSPSRKFGTLIDGITATSHMGGDLSSYLREESDKYRKAQMLVMKSFIDSLAGIAEAYVALLIALPLALVIMLSVMSFVGAGSMLGGMNPMVLLTLLTFLITPAGVAVLLLMVDSSTPPR